jgi:hypothetical protein
MKKPSSLLIIYCAILILPFRGNTQCINGIDNSGRKCGGTIQTAVSFLRINPDARSAGMGDVGIAVTPDANALFFNPSKIALSDKKFGASLSYTPWFRNLGAKDIYIASQAYYYQLGSSRKHAIGLINNYISYGNNIWIDFNGDTLNTGKPYEFNIDLSYAYQLSPFLALAITAKYIHSDLATGQNTGSGLQIKTGKSFAADLSMTYHKPLYINNLESDFTFGVAIKNIGTKISYLVSSDFLPANLGIGAAWRMYMHPQHSLSFALDFNKLLVPTPNPPANFRDKTVLQGIFNSFSDAPGGFREEIAEINTSFGIEYWYRQFVSARMGLFYEDNSKGGRQYLTFGLGARYKWANLNFSYLPATSSQRGPLDNTKRLSLVFNPSDFKKFFTDRG